MISRKRDAGFSLVEMLVVVAIITILATLILVGLGKMTERARLTVCQNNMRKLADSTLQYANFLNGGRFPGFDFQATSGMAQSRCADEWVWALGFVDTLYYAHSEQTKILPARDSHKVLRCPSDTYYIVNAQKVLSSYFALPVLSDQPLANLSRRGQTPLFFEGDPTNLTGNCGCRFHVQEMPTVAAAYHDGGSNCAYLDGSVRKIGDPPNEKELTIGLYYLYNTNRKVRQYPDNLTWQNANTVPEDANN